MSRGLPVGGQCGKLLLADFLRVNISKTLLKVRNVVSKNWEGKHLKKFKPVSTIIHKVIKWT